MSWSIEEHIGEGRPWPEQVVVYRGETDESLTYARRSLSDMNKMAELMDALATENAKLRELAHLVAEYTSADQCEGCVTKRACNAGELDMCWIRKAILEKLRELGVEVDG